MTPTNTLQPPEIRQTYSKAKRSTDVKKAMNDMPKGGGKGVTTCPKATGGKMPMKPMKGH